MDLLYLNTLKTNSTGAKVLAKKSNTYDELQVRRKEKTSLKVSTEVLTSQQKMKKFSKRRYYLLLPKSYLVRVYGKISKVRGYRGLILRKSKHKACVTLFRSDTLQAIRTAFLKFNGAESTYSYRKPNSTLNYDLLKSAFPVAVKSHSCQKLFFL